MKKRNTKVSLIPGTKYPVPEVTGGWLDDEPGLDQGGAGAPATLLIVHGLNENADKFRREVRHGTAFDLFTVLGAEHERTVASRRASSAPRNVKKKNSRAELYAEIKAKFPSRGDEKIAEEIARRLGEPWPKDDDGRNAKNALKRLRRALGRTP